MRIEPDAQISGGIVTDNIINAGVMVDFEFRGGAINGGTLGKTPAEIYYITKIRHVPNYNRQKR